MTDERVYLDDLEIAELEDWLEGANPVYRDRILTAARQATEQAAREEVLEFVQRIANDARAEFLGLMDMGMEAARVRPAAQREVKEYLRRNIQRIDREVARAILEEK